jgi:hypothetical protein
MAVCVFANSNDILVLDSSHDLATCSMVLLESSDYHDLVDYSQLSSGEIATSFAWGFSTYMFFWFMGYVVKNARQIIRHI